MAESAHELKKALAKFSKTELLLVSEAAEILRVSETYLAEQIRSGKAKAFQAGDHWFIERCWVNDFRLRLKKILAAEKCKCGCPLKHRFVRLLPVRRGWRRFF